MIAQYYREIDPLKRRKLLKKAIAEEGRDPQTQKENEIRKELWKMRYSTVMDKATDSRADAFMKFWMGLEYERNSGGSIFGGYNSSARRIRKDLKSCGFKEMEEKSDLHRELLYRECVQLVWMYGELSLKDKSYGNSIFGIIRMSEDDKVEKLSKDIRATGIEFPRTLGMGQELDLISRATAEAYDILFSQKMVSISEEEEEEDDDF